MGREKHHPLLEFFLPASQRSIYNRTFKDSNAKPENPELSLENFSLFYHQVAGADGCREILLISSRRFSDVHDRRPYFFTWHILFCSYPKLASRKHSGSKQFTVNLAQIRRLTDTELDLTTEPPLLGKCCCRQFSGSFP